VADLFYPIYHDRKRTNSLNYQNSFVCFFFFRPQPINIPTPSASSSQLIPVDGRYPPPTLPPINAQSLPNPPMFPLRSGTQPQM